MHRAMDWPARLDAAVEAARLQRFEWGRHDCALWVADVVRQLRPDGTDYAAPLRGKYRSAGGALRLLARRGGLAWLVTQALGEPIPVRQAQRGDVCLACRSAEEYGACLGICLGERVAFVGPQGLSFLPLLECDQAWHV